MKLILLQLGRLVLAVLGLYAALLAVSFVLVPPVPAGQRLDTARASSSLFLTEPKYVFLSRNQLNSTADKVLLLGASNTMAGFKQEQVQALVPDAEVHNISVGGSNITQLGQIVQLVREVQTPSARQHDCYVLGLWYGLFADDKARWYTRDRTPGDTDIDIERYRYGFYRRTAHGPAPLLPASDLDAGVLLIHPYLVLDRSTRDLTQSLRDFLSHKSKPITDEQRNLRVVSVEEQHKYLAFWRDYMGSVDTLTDAPFRELDRVVAGILADGGQVVLVDMPIPEWHSQGAPLYADYRKRIDDSFARWQGRAGVSVLRMGDQNESEDFSDEVHPKPRVSPHWAERLALTLNENSAKRRAQAANEFTRAP